MALSNRVAQSGKEWNRGMQRVFRAPACPAREKLVWQIFSIFALTLSLENSHSTKVFAIESEAPAAGRTCMLTPSRSEVVLGTFAIKGQHVCRRRSKQASSGAIVVRWTLTANAC
jgi:hypothetical protein